MFIYNNSNGNLSRNGKLIGIGYSGSGAGLNNPLMDGVVDVGPIPAGEYAIGDFYNDPEKGQLAAHLTPKPGTDTLGRGGFMIHGDNQEMNHTASHGCIIFTHEIRVKMAFSGDEDLLVV
jgi:hypothetical protein